MEPLNSTSQQEVTMQEAIARNNQSDVAHLTPDLLANGAVRAHNFESFGRAIVAEALRQASSAKVNAAGTKIPTEITIRPSSIAGRDPTIRTVCIDVCVGPVCVHVMIE
jgi:predicted signal transduction protein with EAL and GGDEF domain